MLLLIDRQMEAMRCVDCHVLCESGRRRIKHQFIDGCYRHSLCPDCYLKYVRSEISLGQSYSLEMVFLAGEDGIQPVMTDAFKQVDKLKFSVEKISVRKNRYPGSFFARKVCLETHVKFKDFFGRQWRGVRYDNSISGFAGGDFSVELVKSRKPKK